MPRRCPASCAGPTEAFLVMGWLTAVLLLLGGPARAAESPPRTQIVDGKGIKLVLVPAGAFLMGAPSAEGEQSTVLKRIWRSAQPDDTDLQSERPQHPVRISKPFYMSASEITKAQFAAFVKATGYLTEAEKARRGARGFDRRGHSQPGDAPPASGEFASSPAYTWKNPGFPQGDDHPVVAVSWNDAVAFTSWLAREEKVTYRLPTEAEWEYACRAGTSTWFSFGNDVAVAYRYANLGDAALERAHPGHVMRQQLVDLSKDPADGYTYTSPVAHFLPNAFGLFDMHGNVWEWCQDRYSSATYRTLDPRTPAVDPLGPARDDPGHDRRVLRGGSWYVNALTARSSSRLWSGPSEASCYSGFRVVRER